MKTSNGMKKFFIKFLFLTILFFIFPTVSFAQISKVVFTTDSQTIKPNEVSGVITIQTQDSGGNSFKTPETLDLEFVSTSITGEFLNSSGNTVTTYMSKNTANRSFYYRDSAEGSLTITVNATGRESGKKWSTNQIITISNPSSDDPLSDSYGEGEVLGDSDGPSQYSGGGSTTNVVSSPSAKLEVSAGNNRTTSPGSPIWFQATIKKNTTKTGIELNWSFGDGNVGVGSLVSHTYKYPGDYVVVLNAKVGDIFSVSRLVVRVIKSNIVIYEKDGYLEIYNKGNTEINLFNWRIECKGKGFIFQPDTIILPRASIKLDKDLLKLKGYDNSMGISLKNFLGEEVFSIDSIEEVDMKEVSLRIDEIQKQAYSLINKAISAKLVVESSPIPKDTSLGVGEIKGDSIETKEVVREIASSSAKNIIYQVPKKEGIVSKIAKFFMGLF